MDLTYTFTQEESQIILNALIKEPYATVVNVVDKLQSQASEQMKEEESAAK